MRKILFLVTQSEMGGAQGYIYEVSKALAERYEILVAAGQGDGELFEKIRSTKSEIRNLNLKYLKRAPWPWQIILAIGEIYNLLGKERPDVLFLCSTTAGLLGSLAGFLYKLKIKNLKFKIIYRIGGWAFRDPRPSWKNWLIFLTEKFTARFKDQIIVNSEYDWRIAVKNRIVSPEKIIKIYNGLDPDSLEFLPKEEARNLVGVGHRMSNNTLVGCVANFYKTKGLEYLIEAAAKFVDTKHRQTKFVVIGDGQLRPKLENLIKKYNLENQVFLMSRIPNAYKYLKAFDIFVLPSLKEGFPWVILEAMAAELPIVATDVGALPEIIEDGKEGFLVPPKNSQILAEKIKWLLENPQETKVLGIQAKAKLIKEFSLQRMIEATENIIL